MILSVVELMILGARLRCPEVNILRVFKVVKSPSYQGVRMTWVWSIGEVCQGTIAQGAIKYHVCFNNESNNEITKMN